MLAAGGLPVNATGDPGSAATLDLTWHRLRLSDAAKQEPFLTSELGPVRFAFSAGGSRVAAGEGGARPAPLLWVPGINGPFNGLWYSAVDNATFGLFVSASQAAPGLLSGYLLRWPAGGGDPTWQKLSAAWPGSAAGATTRAWLDSCRLAGAAETCTRDMAAPLQLAMDASGKRATLTGVPGVAQPVVLLKAHQLNPLLAPTD